MDLQNAIQTITVAALPLIFAITLHEAAHGWVASKLGDKTALMLGRVSLNPAKHIDPIGTVILPLCMLLFGGFVFGWAKPVPITAQNLHHPRRDMALVALAGHGANLAMALIWGLIAKLGFTMIESSYTLLHGSAEFFILAGKFGIMINVVLFILNLIPIPPLDGSRLVSCFLPKHLNAQYERIEPFGVWILLALLVMGALQFILFPPVYGLMLAINRVMGIDL